MNRLFAMLATLALLSVAASVRATTADHWTLCNSCSTQTQFQNAAVEWVGNRIGTFEVLVGNINSSKVYRISVTTTAYPSNPASSDPPVRFRSSLGHGVLLLPTPPTKVVVRGTAVPSAYATVNYSAPEPSEVEAQFAAVVVLFGKQPLIAPGPKMHGFDSFLGREPAAVCPATAAAMDGMSPGWRAGAISPPSLVQLISLLGYFYGRGPRVHVIFHNGDVASFQPHPTDNNACAYVQDTAKDKDGVAIEESGGVGNPSGGAVTVVPHPGSGQVHYGSGSYWMVCSFQGEVLLECYVTWVPPA